MKKHIFLISLVLISTVSFGQRRIKKFEVTEKGFDVDIGYTPIIDEITHDGVIYQFTPISPDELNTQFIKENSFSGKFNYSYLEESRESYFIKKRKRRREKSDYEFLLEGADWLFENDRVNNEESEEFFKQIIFSFDEEQGNEKYNIDRFVGSNPYYIGGKYLSVYKISITNSTDSYKLFNKTLLFESGDQLHTPLLENEILNLLEIGNINASNKQQTLLRNHFSIPLSIPPKSFFTKYLAILPIDYQKNEIKLSFEGNNNIARWRIEKEEQLIDEKYIYFEFDVDYYFNGASNISDNQFHVLVCPPGVAFLDLDKLYIDENQLGERIQILTLSLRSDKLYYSRQYVEGNVLVDLEKNKRKTLQIDLEEIKDLKKKVKI